MHTYLIHIYVHVNCFHVYRIFYPNKNNNAGIRIKKDHRVKDI